MIDASLMKQITVDLKACTAVADGGLTWSPTWQPSGRTWPRRRCRLDDRHRRSDAGGGLGWLTNGSLRLHRRQSACRPGRGERRQPRRGECKRAPRLVLGLARRRRELWHRDVVHLPAARRRGRSGRASSSIPSTCRPSLRFYRDFVSNAPDELTVHSAVMTLPDVAPGAVMLPVWCGEDARASAVSRCCVPSPGPSSTRCRPCRM